MKINSDVISGNVIRDTEVYVVEDNRFLNNLCVSKTILHPNKETSGHSHPGLEEVYFFKSGTGIMQLDDQRIDVKSDDIILERIIEPERTIIFRVTGPFIKFLILENLI